jgi:hypothetical protein
LVVERVRCSWSDTLLRSPGSERRPGDGGERPGDGGDALVLAAIDFAAAAGGRNALDKTGSLTGPGRAQFWVSHPSPPGQRAGAFTASPPQTHSWGAGRSVWDLLLYDT